MKELSKNKKKILRDKIINGTKEEKENAVKLIASLYFENQEKHK